MLIGRHLRKVTVVNLSWQAAAISIIEDATRIERTPYDCSLPRAGPSTITDPLEGVVWIHLCFI